MISQTGEKSNEITENSIEYKLCKLIETTNYWQKMVKSIIKCQNLQHFAMQNGNKRVIKGKKGLQ